VLRLASGRAVEAAVVPGIVVVVKVRANGCQSGGSISGRARDRQRSIARAQKYARSALFLFGLTTLGPRSQISGGSRGAWVACRGQAIVLQCRSDREGDAVIRTKTSERQRARGPVGTKDRGARPSRPLVDEPDERKALLRLVDSWCACEADQDRDEWALLSAEEPPTRRDRLLLQPVGRGQGGRCA